MKKFGMLILVLTSVICANAQENVLESRKYDAKGCLQMRGWKRDTIREKGEFLKQVRDDADRGRCLKVLEKIDFEKNSLFGVNINSGYCRSPLGLKFTAKNDVENKAFVINISYIKPNGVCRALSSYDLWVVLPKPPGDYLVRYEITELERQER
jgi:hypothetical protein